MYMDSSGISALAERNISNSRLRDRVLPPDGRSHPIPAAVREEPPGKDRVETVLASIAENGRILVAAGTQASGFAQAIGQKKTAEKLRAATKSLERVLRV